MRRITVNTKRELREHYLPIGTNGQTVRLDENIYITLPQDIYQEIEAYVTHYTTEVSGCGLVKRIVHKDDEGKVTGTEYQITELFLPMQENTAASTEIDEEEVHKLMTQLIQDDKDPNELRLHWHSHADMDTFHSCTDEENYSDLLHGDYILSLVLNRNGKILGRLDIKEPIRLKISGVPVYAVVPMGMAQPTQTRIDANLKALDDYTEEQAKKKQYTGFNNNWYRWIGGRRYEKNYSYEKKCYVWNYSPIIEKTDDIFDTEIDYTEEELDTMEKETDTKLLENLTDEQMAKFEDCKDMGDACAYCDDRTACGEYWGTHTIGEADK